MAIHRLDDIGGQRFVNRVNDKGMYPDGKGLYLQVGEGGASKSWIFRFLSPTLKRERQKGLGPAHTIGLAAAREKARECRQLLLKGIDPLEQDKTDERNRQLELGKQITFRQCGEEWFQNNEADWEPNTIVGQRHRLEKHIYPKFGDLPIQTFDMRLPDSSAIQLVEEFLRPFWRKQRNTANKLQQHIFGILNTALAKRYITGGNAASMRKDSPLRILFGNSKYRAKTFSHLPFEELPEFMAKLRGRIESAGRLRAGTEDPLCQVCASPHVNEIHAARRAGAGIDQLAGRYGIHRATLYRHLRLHFGVANVAAIRAPIGAIATEFIILVPARKMQVAAAEWKDIKEIEGISCLVSPAQGADGRQGHKTGKKTGKDYAIPLSKQAVALLDWMKQYQKANGIKSDYVFPGGQCGRGSGHLGHSTVNKFLNVSLGRPDITVHGFRHTFGNWAHREGYPEADSEIALGHIYGNKTRNSYKDDIVRLHAIQQMLQAYANYCDRGAPLPDQKNVPSFQKYKAARRAG